MYIILQQKDDKYLSLFQFKITNLRIRFFNWILGKFSIVFYLCQSRNERQKEAKALAIFFSDKRYQFCLPIFWSRNDVRLGII